MTVKERLRRIIDELPEEVPETAIEATEKLLRPYRETFAPTTNRSKGETLEERLSRVDAAYGCARGVPFTVEDLHRERRAEVEREEARFASQFGGRRP